MKDKKKLLLGLSVCSVILAILSLGVIYATNILSSKGELNGDNIIDYNGCLQEKLQATIINSINQ